MSDIEYDSYLGTLIDRARDMESNTEEWRSLETIRNRIGDLERFLIGTGSMRTIYENRKEEIEETLAKLKLREEDLAPRTEEPEENRTNLEIAERNLCQRIVSNGVEPELGTDLPISSRGTRNNVARDGSLPVGSALKTSAGNLATAGGIQAIIHAAPETFAGNEDQFLQGVALAVKNSMVLASQQRYGYRRVAIPFIGSAIFGGGVPAGNLVTGGCDRAKLARVIVKSAIEQSGI